MFEEGVGQFRMRQGLPRLEGQALIGPLLANEILELADHIFGTLRGSWIGHDVQQFDSKR